MVSRSFPMSSSEGSQRAVIWAGCPWSPWDPRSEASSLPHYRSHCCLSLHPSPWSWLARMEEDRACGGLPPSLAVWPPCFWR